MRPAASTTSCIPATATWGAGSTPRDPGDRHLPAVELADVFDSLKKFEARSTRQELLRAGRWGNTSIIYRSDLVDIKEES